MGELEELADKIKRDSLGIAKEIILRINTSSLTETTPYIDIITQLGLAEIDPDEGPRSLTMYRLTPEGLRLKLATQADYGRR